MKSPIQKALLLISATALTTFSQGCGSSSPGTATTITPLAPIVKSALPAALTPGAIAASTYHEIRPTALNGPSPIHALFTATSPMSIAANYITNMFQNYYAVGLSSNIQGYLLAQVAVLDGRSNLYSGATSSAHSCLSATTNSYTADFSALNPADTTASNMLKFTLSNVSCSAIFSGNQGSTGGSGEVFGISGTTNSEWTTVTDMAGDPLATGGLTSLIMGNLTNIGSTAAATPQTVNGLVLNYNGSGSTNNANTYAISRFKAVPTLNTFEMYYTSNQSSQGSFSAAASGSSNGASNYMGPGYRVISDGKFIYADGVLCSDFNGPNCGSGTATVTNSGTLTMAIGGTNVACSGANCWTIFQVCMNATTMAVVDPVATADCLTLSNAFTLSPNATPFTTQGIFTGGGNPVTQDPMLFTNITGDNNLVDTTQLTMPSNAQLPATALAKLTANYKATAASSVTTAF